MIATVRGKTLILATLVLVPFFLSGGQTSYANQKASPPEQILVTVSAPVLQELLEERCEIEARHRLAQDNPENQTEDDFTFLCINRWQVRLQGKE